MSIDNSCPKCGASDLGGVIPPHINRGECYGPQGTRWRRHRGIEDPLVFDGISWWQCCECKHVWNRFPWGPDYHKPGDAHVPKTS